MTQTQPLRLDERAAMARALELAARGPRGANPLVGAVIVDDAGRLLGEGWHHGAGTPHAEPTALEDARRRGNDPRGAHMLVTLEPCSHTGRTGPCTEAVLAAGIARLTFAAADTTEQASGGAARLASQGVEVSGGLLAEQSQRLNARWSRAMREKRPFVTAKFATSQDFCVAAADGTSQWITSPEARAHAQQLRGRVDAILVGTGTVAADNPRLTARTPEGEEAARQPLRAVIGLGEVPEDALIRGTDGRFRHLKTRSPRAALDELAAEGVSHVMIEGGGTVLGAFWDAGLIDEYWHYQAPLLLPGGIPAFRGAAAPTLAAGTKLHIDDVHRIGPDLLIRSSHADREEFSEATGIN